MPDHALSSRDPPVAGNRKRQTGTFRLPLFKVMAIQGELHSRMQAFVMKVLYCWGM